MQLQITASLYLHVFLLDVLTLFAYKSRFLCCETSLSFSASSLLTVAESQVHGTDLRLLLSINCELAVGKSSSNAQNEASSINPMKRRRSPTVENPIIEQQQSMAATIRIICCVGEPNDLRCSANLQESDWIAPGPIRRITNRSKRG